MLARACASMPVTAGMPDLFLSARPACVGRGHGGEGGARSLGTPRMGCGAGRRERQAGQLSPPPCKWGRSHARPLTLSWDCSSAASSGPHPGGHCTQKYGSKPYTNTATLLPAAQGSGGGGGHWQRGHAPGTGWGGRARGQAGVHAGAVVQALQGEGRGGGPDTRQPRHGSCAAAPDLRPTLTPHLRRWCQTCAPLVPPAPPSPQCPCEAGRGCSPPRAAGTLRRPAGGTARGSAWLGS